MCCQAALSHGMPQRDTQTAHQFLGSFCFLFVFLPCSWSHNGSVLLTQGDSGHAANGRSGGEPPFRVYFTEKPSVCGEDFTAATEHPAARFIWPHQQSSIQCCASGWLIWRCAGKLHFVKFETADTQKVLEFIESKGLHKVRRGSFPVDTFLCRLCLVWSTGELGVSHQEKRASLQDRNRLAQAKLATCCRDLRERLWLLHAGRRSSGSFAAAAADFSGFRACSDGRLRWSSPVQNADGPLTTGWECMASFRRHVRQADRCRVRWSDATN